MMRAGYVTLLLASVLLASTASPPPDGASPSDMAGIHDVSHSQARQQVRLNCVVCSSKATAAAEPLAIVLHCRTDI